MIVLEPITALVGLWIGIKDKQHQRTMEALGANQKMEELRAKERSEMRWYDMRMPAVQWTKRVLAFTIVGTWCVLHLGMNLPELLGLTGQVTIGYTEIVPKFLFFGEKEAVKWVTTTGPAITPAFNHAVMLIMGFYFGSGGSKK